MLEVGNKGITIRRLKSLGVGALVWRWREFMGQDRAQNDLFPALCAKYGIEIGSAANAWLLLVLEGKMRTVWITVRLVVYVKWHDGQAVDSIHSPYRM